MVDNQHRKIKGYRDLTEIEIELVNHVKTHGEIMLDLFTKLETAPGIDKRWLAIAKTDLQKGFMSLVRSIARPDSF